MIESLFFLRKDIYHSMPTATSTQLLQYETAPARVAEAIAGLSDAQIRQVTSEEAWSIHEVVVHLADAELVGSWRLRKILAEPDVTLQNYDEEGWAKNLSYSAQRREQALALFTMQRAVNTELLRLLPPEAWEKTAQHETRGTISVYDLFMLLSHHVDDHLEQIEQIKQALPEILP
jgi:hypothetical protein